MIPLYTAARGTKCADLSATLDVHDVAQMANRRNDARRNRSGPADVLLAAFRELLAPVLFVIRIAIALSHSNPCLRAHLIALSAGVASPRALSSQSCG